MISQAELKQSLAYDPETGIFTWAKTHSSRAVQGMRAGYTNRHGYLIIGVKGTYYKGHDLAWLYMIGNWPSSILDHKNRNPSDNRFENLRLSNNSLNIANTRAFSTNSTGLKGVVPMKTTKPRKFRAQVMKDGKTHYIGTYLTAQEAHDAYRRKATELFGEHHSI